MKHVGPANHDIKLMLFILASLHDDDFALQNLWWCGQMWNKLQEVFFWLLSGIEYFEKGHRFSSSLKLFWSTIFSGFCSKRTSPQQQLDAWIHLPNTKETGHVYAHVRKHSREESWKKSRLPAATDFCQR